MPEAGWSKGVFCRPLLSLRRRRVVLEEDEERDGPEGEELEGDEPLLVAAVVAVASLVSPFTAATKVNPLISLISFNFSRFEYPFPL